MADVPSNEKLYGMVVNQAKQKYRIYPSPGASHWVHKRYLELGGKFVDPAEENEKKRRAQAWMEASHKLHGSHKTLSERYKEQHYNDHNKRD